MLHFLCLDAPGGRANVAPGAGDCFNAALVAMTAIAALLSMTAVAAFGAMTAVAAFLAIMGEHDRSAGRLVAALRETPGVRTSPYCPLANTPL